MGAPDCEGERKEQPLNTPLGPHVQRKHHENPWHTKVTTQTCKAQIPLAAILPPTSKNGAILRTRAQPSHYLAQTQKDQTPTPRARWDLFAPTPTNANNLLN